MVVVSWIALLFIGLPVFTLIAQAGPLVHNSYPSIIESIVTVDNVLQERKDSTKRITLDVERVTLEGALSMIAEKANLKLSFSRSEVSLSGLVTAKFRDVPVSDVLERITRGTSVVARIASDGQTILISRRIEQPLSDSAKVAVGTVSGRIIDSSTKGGVRGASVVISGTKIGTVTNTTGEFTLNRVPIGERVIAVKLFGYKSVNRAVTVSESGQGNLTISLAAVATSLAGVVTTATGTQRRVEIGNDVTKLNVDSLIKAVPVETISDLLATRVPGVYATPSSGSPGAPTKIRIRGMSSINQSNDPIVIVDGIRLASDQTKNSRNMAVPNATGNQGFLTSSPLDLIDINNVETLEVFKGPSAVALYGSDAANGVIVITTKRGKSGAARYTANISFGMESIPGKWPVNYHMWGHSKYDETIQMRCTLRVQVEGTCIPVNLISYQILDDSRRTPLGRGFSQSYSTTVSGGAGGLNYSLTGSIGSAEGMLKLPKVDAQLLRESGKSIPSWVRNPESNVRRSLGLNVGTEVGRHSNISLSSQLMHTSTAGSPLRNALTYANNAPPETDTMTSGLLTAIPNFRTKIGNQFLKYSTSLDLQSNVGPLLKTQFNIGGDWSFRNDRVSLGATECFVVTATCSNDGIFNTAENLTTVLTSNARASLPLRAGRFVSFNNSLGLNWVRNQDRTLRVNASGLAVGATSGNEAAVFTQNQMQNDRITAGVYLETVIGIANRWYLPLAIRTDAGSALGSQIAPKFPKLGLSYVLSDDNWFLSLPGASAISMLRIRGAFGSAGVQPDKSRNLRTFQSGFETINNSTVQFLSINTIGNTRLRPERSKEYEAGFDLDVLNDRISTTFTFYRKLTNDLIIDEMLPPSIAGLMNQQINLGDLKNTGIEVTVRAVPLDMNAARLSSDFSLSRNKNKLLKLGSRANGGAKPSGVAVGYPLYGYWAREVLGIYDLNEDGYISSTEYILNDSATFLGAPYPSFSLSSNQSLSLFRDITIQAFMQYEHKLTQRREEGAIRANFDPNTPLNVQAAHLYSDMNKIQTLSFFRLQELTLTYAVSPSMTPSILGSRNMRISLRASNVGLWTTYRGKDPKVNGSGGEIIEDNGVIPKPRKWQLTLSII